MTMLYAGGGCAAAQTATVFLPLPVDAITFYEVPQPGLVKLYTQHRAPVPMPQLAAAAVALDQPMVIVGLPGGPFALTAREVRDDSAMSFLVYSVELAVLVTAAALLTPPPALYLMAPPLPGPAALARVVTTCMGALLAAAAPQSTPCAPLPHWQFAISYFPVFDAFELHVRPPYPGRVAVEGPISEYMGFGSPLVWDTGALLQVPHIGKRFQQGPSFASVEVGDPPTPTALAERLQAGFNAFIWQPFTFGIGFPGFVGVLPPVDVPGGCMDLEGLAVQISEQLAAYAVANTCPLVECTTQTEPYPGLVFFSDPIVIFTLDWTVDAGFRPARVGFDFQAYPAQERHAATQPAKHTPALPSLCGPTCCAAVQFQLPPCAMEVTYRRSTQQLALQTQPLPCFSAAVTLPDPVISSNLYVVTAITGWRHGLVPGAQLVLSFYVAGVYTQVQTVVVTVLSNTAVTVAVMDTGPVILTAMATAVELDLVSACPSECCPFVLFLQRRNADTNASTTDSCVRVDLCTQGFTDLPDHGQTVDPEVFGFDAATYPSCGCILVSPGSLKICQESYVLVCLAFSAGDTIPCTGDVYYPFHGDSNSPIVFAKVLRSTFLRADFDRMFDHRFAGTGIHLGYIRVRILNPNGTLYQTHGHSLTITLKFDSYTTLISFGDGHVVLPGEDGRVTLPPVSRGTLFTGQATYY